MTNQEAIAQLERAAPHPEDGLPEELLLFISRMAPLINVDLLVQDEAKRVLLTWRDDEFYGAGWHVPGSIIRYKEHAADRIRRCAQDELGCAVEFDPAPVTIIESMDTRRNRGHFISMLYRCRLAGEPDPARRAGGRPRRGDWMWHERCPPDFLALQFPYQQFLES